MRVARSLYRVRLPDMTPLSPDLQLVCAELTRGLLTELAGTARFLHELATLLERIEAHREIRQSRVRKRHRSR
jgi:hypothetical protein